MRWKLTRTSAGVGSSVTVESGFWLNRRALSALQRQNRFDVWHAFVLYPAGVVLADWHKQSVYLVWSVPSGMMFPASRTAATTNTSRKP